MNGQFYPVVGDAYLLNELSCSARRNFEDSQICGIFLKLIGEKLERMSKEGDFVLYTGDGTYYPTMARDGSWLRDGDTYRKCYKTDDVVNRIVWNPRRFLVRVEWT